MLELKIIRHNNLNPLDFTILNTLYGYILDTERDNSFSHVYERSPRVTYWPSTEPSIKKQMHPVEDIGILPWPVDGLNSVRMRRPQEAGGRQTGRHRRFS